MVPGNAVRPKPNPPVHDTARKVLVAFVFTFMASRTLVFLIMSRRMPDLYIQIGGTHVHHLNYGIFLLSGVGAYLLFGRPTDKKLTAAAMLYGVGLALTFDEFGMWLHLDAHYWQRASFDAVVVIAGLLGILAAAPTLRQFRPRHWTTAIALGVAVVLFGLMLRDSLRYAGHRIGPRLQQMESAGPH